MLYTLTMNSGVARNFVWRGGLTSHIACVYGKKIDLKCPLTLNIIISIVDIMPIIIIQHVYP